MLNTVVVGVIILVANILKRAFRSQIAAKLRFFFQAEDGIRDRARPGPADPDAAPARDGDDEFAEHRRRQPAQQPDAEPARGVGDYRRATASIPTRQRRIPTTMKD